MTAWLTTLRKSAHFESNGGKTWVEVRPEVWQPLLDVAEAAETLAETYANPAFYDSDDHSAHVYDLQESLATLERAVADTTQADA